MSANNQPTYTSDEDVIDALFKCGGNVRKTAALLKLKNVHELRQRIFKKPALAQAKQEALESLLDKAEAKVTDKMTKADAKWILERKGRSRGYGNVLTNANLNFNVDTYDFSKYPLEDRIRLLEMISGSPIENTDTE